MPEKSRTSDLVALARRSFEAGSKRELNLVSRLLAPDAVWDMSPLGMGVHEGRAAIEDQARAAAERLAEERG